MPENTPDTRRTTISLPGLVYERLEQWAREEKRPTANLAAYLVEQGVRIRFPDDFPPPIQRKD